MVGKTRITLFGILFTFAAHAGPQTLDCQSSALDKNLDDILAATQKVEEDCPKPAMDRVLSLCMAVADGSKDPENPRKYQYMKTLKELSCQKSTDSEEVAKKKVKEMWDKYHLSFACDISEFNVSNGNILKLSIDSTFTRFVKDMIRNYGINVHFKDPADGKTLIEYLDKEIAAAKRSNSIDKLAELEEVKQLISEQGQS